MSSSINVDPVTAERPRSSSNPATPRQRQPPLASYFVPNDQAPVMLIEASISGRSGRRMVTEELLKSYVERDYTVSNLSDQTIALVTQTGTRLRPKSRSIIAISRDAKTLVSSVISRAPLHTRLICYSWSRRIGEYNGEMIPLPLSLEHYNRIAPDRKSVV